MDDGPSTTNPFDQTPYQEVEELSSGFVKIRIIDDIVGVTVPRGISVEPRYLPKHLSEHLRLIVNSMRKDRVGCLEIPLSFGDGVCVDRVRRKLGSVENEDRLRTFAIMIFWFCERREKRDSAQARLAVLCDNQDAIDRQISDLEANLKAARSRSGEMENQIVAMQAMVKKLSNDLELRDELPALDVRDRASQRVPPGRRKPRVAAK